MTEERPQEDDAVSFGDPDMSHIMEAASANDCQPRPIRMKNMEERVQQLPQRNNNNENASFWGMFCMSKDGGPPPDTTNKKGKA